MLSVYVSKASTRLKHFILLITHMELAQKHYAVKHFWFSGVCGDFFPPSLNFHNEVAQKWYR